MTTSPTPYEIRPTTPDLFEGDLAAGRILLDTDDAQAIAGGLGQVFDFYVAATETGEPRGQVGVRWINPTSEELRNALGITTDDEIVPNIAFMEVSEGYRRQGIGRALMQTVYEEARRRGHRRMFLSVALGNTVGRAFYESEAFVDTGFRREMPQYNRQPDGSYGEPIMTQMAYLTKDLES